MKMLHLSFVDGRGYIEYIRELQTQLEGGKVPGIQHFDDIVMACGRFVIKTFTQSIYTLQFDQLD